MYSKFPKTSAEAARKVRDLLANRLTVNDAINLAKDCERAGLHDGATLDELMALLAPFAFSSHTDLWHAFKEGWDPFSLSDTFQQEPDVETHLANVLWLSKLLAEHGRSVPAYDLLLSNLRSLDMHKGTELTELLDDLRQQDAFHQRATRLDLQRESFASA